MAVGRWVSSKSSTLAPAALRNAALSTSMRSPRPITVACWQLENSASDDSAISTGSLRQPESATAKKFSSARLAPWHTACGIPSHRVSTTKRAKPSVMPGLCSMELSLRRQIGGQHRLAADDVGGLLRDHQHASIDVRG